MEQIQKLLCPSLNKPDDPNALYLQQHLQSTCNQSESHQAIDASMWQQPQGTGTSHSTLIQQQERCKQLQRLLHVDRADSLMSKKCLDFEKYQQKIRILRGRERIELEAMCEQQMQQRREKILELEDTQREKLEAMCEQQQHEMQQKMQQLNPSEQTKLLEQFYNQKLCCELLEEQKEWKSLEKDFFSDCMEDSSLSHDPNV
eukprot:GHVP01032783.1.p1 GENE.GHVP01032783.1~~GHVP01032783.1.p1  ORF type:complete len:216 (+),score=37.01 GHVP01032783.1:44-649(+)